MLNDLIAVDQIKLHQISTSGIKALDQLLFLQTPSRLNDMFNHSFSPLNNTNFALIATASCIALENTLIFMKQNVKLKQGKFHRNYLFRVPAFLASCRGWCWPGSQYQTRGCTGAGWTTGRRPPGCSWSNSASSVRSSNIPPSLLAHYCALFMYSPAVPAPDLR